MDQQHKRFTSEETGGDTVVTNKRRNGSVQQTKTMVQRSNKRRQGSDEERGEDSMNQQTETGFWTTEGDRVLMKKEKKTACSNIGRQG